MGDLNSPTEEDFANRESQATEAQKELRRTSGEGSYGRNSGVRMSRNLDGFTLFSVALLLKEHRPKTRKHWPSFSRKTRGRRFCLTSPTSGSGADVGLLGDLSGRGCAYKFSAALGILREDRAIPSTEGLDQLDGGDHSPAENVY